MEDRELTEAELAELWEEILLSFITDCPSLAKALGAEIPE